MGLTGQTRGGLLARRVLAALAEATADPPGVTRAAYGPGEQIAHDLMRAEASALGATAETDAAGNLYLTMRGSEPSLPRLIVGSHADSVPHGGNYDGALGIVVGLAAMADLAASGVRLRRDFTVMAIRAEEAAWFPLSYPGSLAALGRLPSSALEALRSDTGLTLAEHMRLAGLNPEPVRRGVAFLNRDGIAVYLEVHIDQGPRLKASNVPIGLVTGIAGGFRYTEARCLGAYGHSGAEPRFARRDAVVGFAELVHRMDVEWDDVQAEGYDGTITFGRVETDPIRHGASRVLGEVRFALDVRSETASVIDRLRRSVDRICADIARTRNVTFELGPSFDWAPTLMDPDLLTAGELAASAAGVRFIRLPSGAGHDAASFAASGCPTGMIFVRSSNGSHNPAESVEAIDIDCAISMLSQLLRLLDAAEQPCRPALTLP